MFDQRTGSTALLIRRLGFGSWSSGAPQRVRTLACRAAGGHLDLELGVEYVYVCMYIARDAGASLESVPLHFFISGLLIGVLDAAWRVTCPTDTREPVIQGALGGTPSTDHNLIIYI